MDDNDETEQPDIEHLRELYGTIDGMTFAEYRATGRDPNTEGPLQITDDEMLYYDAVADVEHEPDYSALEFLKEVYNFRVEVQSGTAMDGEVTAMDVEKLHDHVALLLENLAKSVRERTYGGSFCEDHVIVESRGVADRVVDESTWNVTLTKIRCYLQPASPDGNEFPF